MAKRFIFVYRLNDDIGEIWNAIPAHIQYWRSAHLDEYVGGPFADRSGGLITFAAGDLHAAAGIIGRDPFVVRGLVREQWVEEWVPQPAAPTAPTASARADAAVV